MTGNLGRIHTLAASFPMSPISALSIYREGLSLIVTLEQSKARLLALGVDLRVADQLTMEAVVAEHDRCTRTPERPDVGRALGELEQRVAVGGTRRRS